MTQSFRPLHVCKGSGVAGAVASSREMALACHAARHRPHDASMKDLKHALLARRSAPVPSQESAALTPAASANIRSPDNPMALRGTSGVCRLIAGQRYFGLEARALHAGAKHVLTRIAAMAPGEARIDVNSVREDFCLDTPTSWTLIRTLLAGGLLFPNSGGGYRVTDQFLEHARARVVNRCRESGRRA